MGGVVESVGQFFGSPVGRGVAGVLTGGTSEIARAASKTATQNIPGPMGGIVGTVASSGLGGTAGDTLGRAAPAASQSITQGGHVGDVAMATGAGTVETVKAQTAGSDAAVAQATTLQQQQADQAAQAARDLAARTETPQEALEARRRALASAALVGTSGTKRNASAYLSGGV